jgi:type II secretory pathway pseudopilin PulG
MTRLKKLNKCQLGLTLVELVIVIGITGVIVGGLTMTIMQVLNMDARTRNDMIAVYQVRQAGKLLSEDVLEAQPDKINVNPPGGTFLVLGWTAQNGTEYGVNYTLGDTPSSEFKILWRKQYHYVGSDPVLDLVTKVAEHIDPYQTSCVWNATAKKFTFTVTATVGERSETRVYQVTPRPGT